MPIVESKDAEKEAVFCVAQLMTVAARTAPKGRGIDQITTAIVNGKDKKRIVEKMIELSKTWGTMKRDAENVEKSTAVVLIGVKGSNSKGLNCGACGFKKCENFDRAKKQMGPGFMGPNCVFFIIDLGIAVCSAVKIASILNVDTRIMFSIGVSAKHLNLLDADVILGIPLSATGKSIYFDRK